MSKSRFMSIHTKFSTPLVLFLSFLMFGPLIAGDSGHEKIRLQAS